MAQRRFAGAAATAPMADYTMPLRGHGIITAERLLYQSYGQGDSRARPAAPMADYTMPLRGHGIITASGYYTNLMPKAIRGRGNRRSDGQLYHAASRTWYNNRRAVIIPILWPTAIRGRGTALPPQWPIIPCRFAEWYNNRRAVIIPILWPTAIRGRGLRGNRL